MPTQDDAVLNQELDAILADSGSSSDVDEKENLIDDLLVDRAPTQPFKWALPRRFLITLLTTAIWILLSSGLVFTNKHLLASFPYVCFLVAVLMQPIFIAALHLLVTAIGAGFVILVKRGNPPNPIPTRAYYALLPIAMLQAVPIVLGNIAYMHSSISLIQMLNACIPVVVTGIQQTMGWRESSPVLSASLVLAGIGSVVLSAPEFKSLGIVFAAPVGAIIIKSWRLAQVSQLLSSHGLDPIQALARSSAIGGVALALLASVVEGAAPLRNASASASALAVSGVVALALNLVTAVLIDTSDYVSALGGFGFVKEILVIITATIFTGAAISASQYIGWLCAVLGAVILRSSTSPTITRKIGSISNAVASFNSNPMFPRLIIVCLIAAASLIGIAHTTTSATTDAANILRSVRYEMDFSLLQQPDREEAHTKGHMKYVHNGKGVDIIPPYDPTIDVRQLPRFAWVVTATPDAIKKHGTELTNLACYAERLGIPFFLEHHLLNTDRTVLMGRHRGVAKHLRYYQWILSTDADFIVGDSTRDVRDFLDDSVDVIFNDRDIQEICTCAFFIRNSPGSWSFMRRWWSWSDHGDHVNGDNGDVVEMVAAGLSPYWPNNADFTGRFHGDDAAPPNTETEACVNADDNWTTYNYMAYNCTVRALAKYRYADDTIPYWDVNLWTFTDILPSTIVRTYKAFAGFQRQIEGTIDLDWGYWFYNYKWPSYSLYGVGGDYLFHGKNLDLLVAPESLFCTGQEWRYPQEQWSVEQTRKEFGPNGYNFTWWPGCFDDSGRNLCKE